MIQSHVASDDVLVNWVLFGTVVVRLPLVLMHSFVNTCYLASCTGLDHVDYCGRRSRIFIDLVLIGQLFPVNFCLDLS